MNRRKVFNKIHEAYDRLRNIRVIDRRELYKLWEVEQLRKVIEAYSVDCIFDVGANYGQYAEMLRKDVGFKGLIISFEPIPDAVDALMDKSRGDEEWVIQGMALSSKDGMQTFNVMKSSQFSSLSEPRHDEVEIFLGRNEACISVEVVTETLGTAYRRLRKQYGFSRPYLKLDTQGYDMEIVSKGRDVLNEFIGLQSELAVKKIYKSSVGYQEAICYYQECGFTLCAFVPNNSGHFPLLIETDCIMINSSVLQ